MTIFVNSLPNATAPWLTPVSKIALKLSQVCRELPLMNCAPKVGHKVKCNGKSELFSKNSSSTDARVREKYQFNLS